MSLIGFFFQNGAQQIEVIGCCFLQIDQPTNQPIEPAPPPKKNKSNQNKEETVLCSERTAAQNVPVKQKPNQIKTTRGAVPNRCLKSMTQKKWSSNSLVKRYRTREIVYQSSSHYLVALFQFLKI